VENEKNHKKKSWESKKCKDYGKSSKIGKVKNWKKRMKEKSLNGGGSGKQEKSRRM
jgi:hypothetical protein